MFFLFGRGNLHSLSTLRLVFFKLRDIKVPFDINAIGFVTVLKRAVQLTCNNKAKKCFGPLARAQSHQRYE